MSSPLTLIQAEHSDPAASGQDMAKMFSYRDSGGRNAYYITPVGGNPNAFPMMIVMVKYDLAYVWVCPEDGHAGFQTVGRSPVLDPNKVTDFRLDREQTLVFNEWVIPVDKALALAIEYHQTGKRSTSIEWFNLDQGHLE